MTENDVGHAGAAESLEPLASGSPLWPSFVAALQHASLPTDDIGDSGQVFFVLRAEGDPIGFGGYESHAYDALLRSLVVPVQHRHVGVGRRILSALVFRLRQDKVERIWLLTNDAAEFFEKQGFVRRPRTAAPAVIAGTREFSSLCPASALLMCLTRHP